MAASRGGRRYRSILYVPGNRPDWIAKAHSYGADALLIDLEDSVPVGDKVTARANAAAAIENAAGLSASAMFVRVNPWTSGALLADLLSVVRPGLAGVFLPKLEEPSQVVALDRVLGELEAERGLPVGDIEICPLCETAEGMLRHYEICLASTRIRRSGMVGFALAGDLTASIGVTLTGDDGDELLPFTVRSGLEARAAGLDHVLGGMTAKVGDPDLVRRLAVRAKSLGANGATVIHPTHVPIVNEVYAPTAAEVEDAARTLRALAAALDEGRAATRAGDVMVDYAHGRTALELLASARAFGLDIPPVPELDLSSWAVSRGD